MPIYTKIIVIQSTYLSDYNEFSEETCCVIAALGCDVIMNNKIPHLIYNPSMITNSILILVYTARVQSI